MIELLLNHQSVDVPVRRMVNRSLFAEALT